MPDDFLEQIRKEITYIKPHQEDDWEWFNEGLNFLEGDELKEAELRFKELIVAEPKHHDGYEGLALTYERLGRKEEALFFMKEALARAQHFLDEGTLDQEVMDEMQQEYLKIQQL